MIVKMRKLSDKKNNKKTNTKKLWKYKKTTENKQKKYENTEKLRNEKK